MSFKTFLLFLVVFLILGGIAALAFMDITPAQQDISKEISYDNNAAQ